MEEEKALQVSAASALQAAEQEPAAHLLAEELSSGKAWKRREKSRRGRKGKERARLTFTSPPASGVFLKHSYN